MTEYNIGDVVNFIIERYNPTKNQFYTQTRTGKIVDKRLYKSPYKPEEITLYSIDISSRSNPGRVILVKEKYIISLHKK